MIKQAGRINPANRNAHGWLLKRPSDGVIEFRNAEGRLLAHYNPRTNETRNIRGELVGKGNRLAAVVLEAERKQALR